MEYPSSTMRQADMKFPERSYLQQDNLLLDNQFPEVERKRNDLPKASLRQQAHQGAPNG